MNTGGYGMTDQTAASEVIVNIPPSEPLVSKLAPPPTDVYKNEDPKKRDHLLTELDSITGIPSFVKYFGYEVLGTALLLLPCLILYLTSPKQQYWGSQPTNPLKGYIFMGSILMALFYSFYLGTLTIVSFLPFILRILEKLKGTPILGARTRSGFKHFLMIRHSFSRLVAIIPSWIFAKWFLTLPHWTPQFVTAALVAMSMLFVKDILIQRLAIVYHKTFQESRIARNKMALKCLKKIRNHYLPKWRHRGSSPLGDLFRAASPDSTLEAPLDEHHPDAKSITSTKAEELSAVLFKEIQTRLGKDCLEKGDLAEILGVKDDASFFELLDVDGNGDLTRKEFVQGLTNVYADRENLVKILAETDDVIARVDSLATYLMAVLAIFVCLNIFDVNLSNVLMLQGYVATVLVFFFQDMCGQLFSSFVFVFVTHPFDTGDSVVIDRAILTVRKIGLWYTSFYGSGRRLVYRKNADLSKAIICNVSRSIAQSDEFTVAVSSSTTSKQLFSLEDRLNKFIRANPRDYDFVTFVKNVKIVSSEAINFCIEYKHRSNFADSALRHRRNVLFLNYFRDSLNILDIKLASYSYDMNAPPS